MEDLSMDKNNNFTYDAYKNLLQVLKENYNVTSFSNVKYGKEKIKNMLILRHDIDQTLSKAVTLAKIERAESISSTYFLFLWSPFYNIFSEASEKSIKEIIGLNHYIGLHFDFTQYEYNNLSQLSYQINSEVKFVEELFRINIDAISFHRPIDLDLLSKLEVSLYPHTYEKLFVDTFKYFSDSRGEWRYGHPLESGEFKERKNMHLLIHPIWWSEDGAPPLECIQAFKDEFMKRFDSNIYEELKSFWINYEKRK